MSGSGYGWVAVMFGGYGYTPAPGDFDGDPKTDLCSYDEITG